tara:strand:+ start:64 stop:294 length:231 start_codon:yes stop_codon:yes gene_type:complete
MKQLSLEEVKKHTTVDSCWIITNGYVYDVSDFLDKHPVDRDIILKKAGTDCSIDYKFHSKKTRKIWKKYRIGKLTS